MRTPIKDSPHRAHATPQDGAIHRDGPLLGMELFSEKIPHWQRYGKGWVTTHFLGHDKAAWLSITTTEAAEKSSKRTMLTLHRDDVERLRDLCNVVLGEVA